ncbi:hypothetical protein DFJ58DRAFT_841670 [Suillus subalutaceus]|uniref:uncharacterized protein n=1 Tax=Suillus subalutaceus TaxID=48586 RepID=UPI001B87B537|nr:uncharacterized protein DFJ58DRAFT_841670 [Suillus subalutaceus]KAG1853494.1 hypothetical protein DFJ58DRAFT_841670 [Suillus subalutaceus]
MPREGNPSGKEASTGGSEADAENRSKGQFAEVPLEFIINASIVGIRLSEVRRDGKFSLKEEEYPLTKSKSTNELPIANYLWMSYTQLGVHHPTVHDFWTEGIYHLSGPWDQCQRLFLETLTTYVQSVPATAPMGRLALSPEHKTYYLGMSHTLRVRAGWHLTIRGLWGRCQRLQIDTYVKSSKNALTRSECGIAKFGSFGASRNIGVATYPMVATSSGGHWQTTTTAMEQNGTSESASSMRFTAEGSVESLIARKLARPGRVWMVSS